MLIKKTGKVSDEFYIVGSPVTPVYLLDGTEPVLFDGGFTALAKFYESGIKEILGDRSPAYLFLTHSHFDHIGAISHFKDIWPDLKIGGSEHCHKILKKTGAIKLIRDLNIEYKKSLKKTGINPLHEEPFKVFDIDIVIKPGQEIQLSSNLIIKALNTPGHTWDFMSYWIPEKKILIASEAVGCYEGNGYIQSEFMIDFDSYLESLRKIEKLEARILCAGHRAVFTDEEVTKHIDASFRAAYDFLFMVEEFLVQEKGEIDRTVSRVKAVQWDNRPWPKQPEPAYILNTRQRVKTIWARMKKNQDNRIQYLED